MDEAIEGGRVQGCDKRKDEESDPVSIPSAAIDAAVGGEEDLAPRNKVLMNISMTSSSS